MTNPIIEILRHHDNPCAVLERKAPRFDPFDLYAALNYAYTRFEDHALLWPSIVMAALNAHHKQMRWQLLSNPLSFRTHLNDLTAWGWSPPTVPSATIGLNDRRSNTYLFAEYQPEHELDDLFIFIEPPDFEPLSMVYTTALIIALEEVGARSSWSDPEHLGTVINAHRMVVSNYVLIPFPEIAPVAKRLEEVVLSGEIVSQSTARGQDRLSVFDRTYDPGPLALQAFERLELSEDLIDQWLHPFQLQRV